MLKRLELRQFQRWIHKRLKLDWITVIVGPNDRGKSAILRALKWVLLNVAPKDKFITRPHKKAQVTAWFEGFSVTRLRNGNHNTYRLGTKEFHAVRQEVPEEIEKLLQVGSINFQAQLDLHLWFHNTPGDLAKQLNSIVNLGIIDATLSALANKERREKTALGLLGEQLEEAKRSERVLRKWTAIRTDFSAVATCESNSRRIGLDVLELNTTIEYIRTAGSRKARSDALADASKSLSILAANCYQSERLIGTLATAISKAKALRAVKHPPQTTRLDAAAKTARQSDRQASLLADLIQEVHETQTKLSERKQTWRSFKKKLDLANSGLCLICGQPFPSQKPS